MSEGNGLREYIYPTACMAVLVFVAFFAAYSGSGNQSQFKQQAPGIEANQQTNSSAKSERDSNAQQERALGAGSILQAAEGAEKGSEDWPIFGFRLKVTDSLLVLFTLFLVIVGILQACQLYRTVVATNRLWDAGERQLVEFKNLAAATKDTAEAATQSAEHFPNVERAYVFFCDADVKNQKVIYWNWGKTPAVVTGIQLGCNVFESPPAPQDAPLQEKTPIGAVIGAGVPWERGTIPLTQDEIIERANAGKGLVYLYGEIHYRDIFKNERWSRFCRCWQGQQFILSDLTDKELNDYT